MLKRSLILITGIFIFMACTSKPQNPFFSEWDTPFQTPPFSEIKEEHFMPAFKAGIKAQQEEIEAISTNPETATFENTIVALNDAGAQLAKVNDVFYNLTGANTNDQIQQIAKDVSPLLSQLRDDIRMNEKLFERVKAVNDQKEKLSLKTEQMRLLDKYYKNSPIGESPGIVSRFFKCDFSFDKTQVHLLKTLAVCIKQ